jgi:hypothetical protein
MMPTANRWQRWAKFTTRATLIAKRSDGEYWLPNVATMHFKTGHSRACLEPAGVMNAWFSDLL